MRVRIGKSIVSLKNTPGGEETVDEGLYGMEAETLEYQGEWVKLRMFYGYEGWAAKEWLLTETDRRIPEENRRIVQASFVDVKAQPSVQAETLLCVPRGAWMETCGAEAKDGWLRVQLFRGRPGYVPQAAVGPGIPKLRRRFQSLPQAEQRRKLAKTALGYLGAPYRWGGRTPLGIDCSGLAQMTYLQNGMIIYRDARLHPAFPVRKIPPEKLCPGDLIYFPGHVAVYLGNQSYIHATAAADRHCVTINSLNPRSCAYRADLAQSMTAAGSIF